LRARGWSPCRMPPGTPGRGGRQCHHGGRSGARRQRTGRDSPHAPPRTRGVIPLCLNKRREGGRRSRRACGVRGWTNEGAADRGFQRLWIACGEPHARARITHTRPHPAHRMPPEMWRRVEDGAGGATGHPQVIHRNSSADPQSPAQAKAALCGEKRSTPAAPGDGALTPDVRGSVPGYRSRYRDEPASDCVRAWTDSYTSPPSVSSPEIF